MSQKLRTPPAVLYMVEDGVVAWMFNRAVVTFGNALESRVEEKTRNSKNQKQAERQAKSVIMSWLSSADAPGKTTGRFRDPAAL